MARFSSDYYKTSANRIMDVIDLTDADNSVIGSGIVWNVATPVAARDLTLENYDESLAANWEFKAKPYMVVKCKKDCSVNNVTIKNAAGSTLYTLDADYSTTEIYVFFILNATNDWVLA